MHKAFPDYAINYYPYGITLYCIRSIHVIILYQGFILPRNKLIYSASFEYDIIAKLPYRVIHSIYRQLIDQILIVYIGIRTYSSHKTYGTHIIISTLFFHPE